MSEELEQRLTAIEEKLTLLLTAIVVQQKDACEIAGVTADTVRNKELRGEVPVLQADGSRKAFVTLDHVGGLKVRSRPKRSFRR